MVKDLIRFVGEPIKQISVERGFDIKKTCAYVVVGFVSEGFLPPSFGVRTGFVDGTPRFEITVVGKMVPLNLGEKYIFVGTATENARFQKYLSVVSVRREDLLLTEQEKRFYLTRVLTPSVTERLFEFCDKENLSPYEFLESKNETALLEIKGFGESTVQSIFEKFEENLDMIEPIVKLGIYGLTDNAIGKIMSVYSDPRVAIREIQANPYRLIEKISGFGWNRVDEIALRFGIARDSFIRVRGYTVYYFTQLASTEGHTWVDFDTFVEELRKIFPEVEWAKMSQYISQMLKQDDLYCDRETRRFALRYYYDLEQNIADTLLDLQEQPDYHFSDLDGAIREAEQITGYAYTDEQIKTVQAISQNKITVVTAKAGCVDCDTEFFNGKGWKRIADYKDGDLVLEYREDGSAVLVRPEKYIKRPANELMSFKTRSGLDLCYSLDHNVPLKDRHGVLSIKKLEDLKREYEHTPNLPKGRIITSFSYGGAGVEMSDWEIRIMCAVISDGYFDKEKPLSHNCKFCLKKERKIKKLKQLLHEGGLNFKEYICKNGNTLIKFISPFRMKTFSPLWYKATKEQLKLICDSIIFWDGTEKGNRKVYSSNNKENADFIQFAFSSCGYKASISALDRRGEKIKDKYMRKSVDYTVSISTKSEVGFPYIRNGCREYNKFVPYKTKDGFQYCFTVPSHMWVMRRNGKIVITGNSGKSSTMLPVVCALQNDGKSFITVALSGKASLNLAEITHSEGETIHRALGANPFRRGEESAQNGPNVGSGEIFLQSDSAERTLAIEEIKETYGGARRLDVDAVILDEVSMVGGELFLHLLEAMPPRAKLIMLGDEGQLEAIGLCNLLADLKKSRVVPVCELHKILRQNARSGIISDSAKIYDKKPIISPNFSGTVIHGELRDFKIVSCQNSQGILNEVLQQYIDWLKEGIRPKDILVLGFKRSIGTLSVYNMNREIQSIANGNKQISEIDTVYKDGAKELPMTYRVNDLVMVLKNSYSQKLSPNSATEERKTVSVFNGNIGVIRSINENDVYIEFPQGEVIYTKAQMKGLQLGYAATVHKAQGSGYPYVIVAVDPSAYTLLTNEALYTAITRAKTKCTLIGMTKTIRMATFRTRVAKKQTWLAELLVKGQADRLV